MHVRALMKGYFCNRKVIETPEQYVSKKLLADLEHIEDGST